MKTARPLRHTVAEYAQLLWTRGWVANHDGNITAKDSDQTHARGAAQLYAATPTATSKRLIDERSVIELDAAGNVIGQGKAFGEIGLHRAVYARRPDVGAVIHAHPPHATAIAASGNNVIDVPFIAEAVVSLGARIPLVEFAAPGEPAVTALAPWCELVDAVLLGNHGVMAWGATVEQAFLRLELVEHLAKIAVLAAPLGGVRQLPAAALPPLLAARAKAGLGRAADRAVESAGEIASKAKAVTPVAACGYAPHATVPTIPIGGASANQPADLGALVREEIVKALRG